MVKLVNRLLLSAKNMNYSKNEYDLPVLIKNNVKVEWVNLDEGYDGDYDPENPNDENLLRFDVSHMVNNEWTEVPDGSYCTQMPASYSDSILQAGLKTIMDAIYDDVSAHGRAKRTCEEMSWIAPHHLVGA